MSTNRFVVTAVVLCSCGEPELPDLDYRMQAEIAGHVVVEFVGDASFYAAPFGPVEGLPHFELTGATGLLIGWPADGYESIAFTAPRERPAVGEHEVSTRSSSSLWAFYQRGVDGYIEQYSALDGTLDIHHSSNQYIEGTFAFEAVLFCRRPQDPAAPIESGSCHPNDLDLSLPRITIVGSVIAKRSPDVVTAAPTR